MAKKRTKVEGLQETADALNAKLNSTVEFTMAGAYAGAGIVLGEAQRRVPVEYNNLRGSGDLNRLRRGVEIVFSASYAAAVHENLEPKNAGKPRPSGLGVYWGPDGEPQFLARSLQRNEGRVIDAMAAHAKEGLKK